MLLHHPSVCKSGRQFPMHYRVSLLFALLPVSRSYGVCQGLERVLGSFQAGFEAGSQRVPEKVPQKGLGVSLRKKSNKGSGR